MQGEHEPQWLMVKQFCRTSGYSAQSVYAKCKSGVWREHEIWVKAPDGRMFIDPKAVNRWIESSTGSKASA